ncbi:MAG: 16S rRNA (cytosine(967)-C(5))-methyltransferase RsmB [Verrucomicrobiota bacterium]
MSLLSSRRAAIEALRRWRTETRFADAIIAKLLVEAKLSSSDRAFALELFYGVLRNLTLLDFWIDCLRPAQLDVDLRDILRLGLYQLFCLETPEHAAVYETVEIARKRGRPVINGILRSAARRQAELRSQAQAQPLFVRTSHPQFLVERWQRSFGEKATEALCAWNNEPPPVYGRINRLKIGPEKFLLENPESKPLPTNPDFVEFHSFPDDALNRGYCYIQDPSTAIACRLLDPHPGEKVLDVCAAPGGKTSYVAALMKNQGLVVACDREPDRLRILEENVARLGLEIARVLPCDWESGCIGEPIASAAPFDRVMVDAPCSNTGVMRRRVDARWRLTPGDFVHMQKRQLNILRAVCPLLKSGGVLVYSTCSLEREENEDVTRSIMAELPILALEDQIHSLPFRDGFDGAFGAKFVAGRQTPG